MRAGRFRLLAAASMLAAFCMLNWGGCSSESSSGTDEAETTPEETGSGGSSTETGDSTSGKTGGETGGSASKEEATQTITISYVSEQGAAPSAKTAEFTGSYYKLTASDIPTLSATGYRFDGWSLSEAGSVVNAGYKLTQDTTLYALWSSISSMGDLRSYYHTIKYLDTDGSAISGLSPSGFWEEDSVDLSTATTSKAGYAFLGWSVSLSDKTIITGWDAEERTGNVTLYAVWSPNTDTPYTVRHFLENTELTGYDEQTSDIQHLTGTTDEYTQAKANTYSGFASNGITQERIAGDGSTVVSIYYDRITTTLTFNLAGGSGTESISGKYGTAITRPQDPSRTGYTFTGWTPELPDTYPLSDETYTAVWTANQLGAITASAPEYSAGAEGLLSADTSGEDEIVFTAAAGHTSYAWYIDGKKQSETGTELTMSSADYSTGYYTVMLIADGRYSAAVQVTVRN